MLFLVLSTLIVHTLAKKPRAKHQSMQDPILSTSQIPGVGGGGEESSSGTPAAEMEALDGHCSVIWMTWGYLEFKGFKKWHQKLMCAGDRGGGRVASPAQGDLQGLRDTAPFHFCSQYFIMRIFLF